MPVAIRQLPRRALSTWYHDLVAGFLVFLIALPLCLGISVASGYPAIAGVMTAVVGGLVCPFITNSELTIKGPAAALIVIAVGAVTELGSGGVASTLADLTADQKAVGYAMALTAGLIGGGLQMLFGLFRLGWLGESFPKSVIQGLLASIGIIIVTKQIYVVLGVQGKSGSTLRQISELPDTLLNPIANGVNPYIALIGVVSLLIMFSWPLIKHKFFEKVPAPIVVLMIAVPLGSWFELDRTHEYTFQGSQFHLDSSFLVKIPTDIRQHFCQPDLSALGRFACWNYGLMFAVVGGLATLVTAKAADLLDPRQRKTDLNRDLIAIGVANVCASLIGGLPMISEIVRSRANIHNGAQTRLANSFHALFLLTCVTLIPGLLQHIPLSALGAMLVYTGIQLVSPRSLFHTYQIGLEQILIVVSTALVGMSTDMLRGLLAGVAVKLMCHLWNGASFQTLFSSNLQMRQIGDHDFALIVRGAAVFSNWRSLKRCLEQRGMHEHLTIDLSETSLVDHTVMEKLQGMKTEFERSGGSLQIIGLNQHQSLSSHPHATQKKTIRSSSNESARASL